MRFDEIRAWLEPELNKKQMARAEEALAKIESKACAHSREIAYTNRTRIQMLMQYLPKRRIGPVCRDIDGTRAIFDFFARHRRTPAAE